MIETGIRTGKPILEEDDIAWIEKVSQRVRSFNFPRYRSAIVAGNLPQDEYRVGSFFGDNLFERTYKKETKLTGGNGTVREKIPESLLSNEFRQVEESAERALNHLRAANCSNSEKPKEFVLNQEETREKKPELAKSKGFWGGLRSKIAGFVFGEKKPDQIVKPVASQGFLLKQSQVTITRRYNADNLF